MMQKRILVLLSIMGTLISACNGGNSSSSAVPKTPKSIAGDPTPSPSTSPYFPGTSESYKSIAVMKNSAEGISHFDYVAVGANSKVYVASVRTNKGISSTQITNWLSVSLPGPVQDANFNQVISCGPYSDNDPGVFLAVGDQGLAYIGYESNGSWSWNRIPVNNTFNIVGATCRPVDVVNYGQNEITTEIVMAANRPTIFGGGNFIIYGDLEANQNNFQPIPSQIGFPGYTTELTAIASDGKGSEVVVGTNGLFAMKNFNDMQSEWSAGRLDKVGNFYAVNYSPVNSKFIYGGSYGIGYVDMMIQNPSQSTISFTPIIAVGGNAQSLSSITLGVNSIGCGESSCLISGVKDVSQQNSPKGFLSSLNPGNGSTNQIVYDYPGLSSGFLMSQVIASNDLNGYYALVGNNIIARKYGDQLSAWSVVSQLP